MEYFIFNGINSNDMNIVIKKLPTISRANQRINTITLEGRSGTLHEIEDKFDSYNIQIECILMPNANINEIKKWLIGQSDLILSDNLNIKYTATVVNKIDFSKYLTFLREFPLEFEVQPIGYSIVENKIIFDKYMNKNLKNVKIFGELEQEIREGAMPSMEAPSPIRAVGSNINKFDYSFYYENEIISGASKKELTENGIRLIFDAGSDAFIGTVGSYGIALPNSAAKIKVNPSTEFVLSLSSAPKCFVGFWDANLKSLGFNQIPSNYKKTEYKFKTPENCKYVTIRLGIRNSAYTSYEFTNIKLEEGTEATCYTSYNFGGIDYKVTGKNKLKLDDIIKPGYTVTNANITYTVNSDYSITIKGTTGSNVSSFVLLGENLNNYATKRWHENRDIVVNFSIPNLGVFCRKTDGTYSELNAAKGSNIGVIYLQVNPNTTINTTIFPYVTYEPDYMKKFELYKEYTQIIQLSKGEYLAKINDYEDYIDKNGTIHHKIGKYVFTGDENFYGETTTAAGLTRFYTSLPKNTISNNSTINVYSNYCKAIPASNFQATDFDSVCASGNYVNLILKNITTLNELKSKLKELYNAENPVEIYYVLDKEITAELGESEKEKLELIKTFVGENNFEFSACVSCMAYTSASNYVEIERQKKFTFNKQEESNIININSTYKTYPLFKIKGNGSVTCNNKTFNIVDNDSDIYIDCELINAYNENNENNENKNNCVSGLEDPIFLDVGKNIIDIIGLDKLEIVYREAWL